MQCLYVEREAKGADAKVKLPCHSHCSLKTAVLISFYTHVTCSESPNSAPVMSGRMPVLPLMRGASAPAGDLCSRERAHAACCIWGGACRKANAAVS